MKMERETGKPRKSIKGKIMCSTSLAILLLVIVCASIMIGAMQILTDTILLDILQPMAKQASKTVESNLHLLADRMMSIASDKRLTEDSGDRESVLEEMRNQYELYSMGLYDLTGQLAVQDGEAASSIASGEVYTMLGRTDNLVIGDPQVLDGRLAIPIGMPVKRNGETVEYLVGYYKYDALNDVLGSVDVGRTGSILMINQDGIIVGHPEQDMVKQNLNIFDLDQADASQAIYRRMISGETGADESEIKGDKVYVAFSPVRGTRWSLAVEVPKADYTYIANRAIFVTMLAALTMILLALILVYRQSRIISTALGKVTRRITLLADGDLHTPLEVARTEDELELLSGALKTTVENVNTYLGEIQNVLSHIAQGELDVHTNGQYRGDFVVVRDSLSHIVDSLNTTLQRIHDASERLSGMADNLSQQSGELQQSSKQQNDTVQLLVQELDGMKGGLKAVSDSTDIAKEKVDEIARRITDGNDRMQHLARAMEEIQKNSAEITKINKIIEDIAFQTNILSLNAAVEAARAGAAGKGFAVVADEVRRLAGQSAEAAKNTSHMIERSGSLVRTGVELADDMDEALRQISEVSGVIEAIITRQLYKTVQDQERSLAEITAHIENISGMADQNRTGAENTAQVSFEVSSEAEQLKAMLRQFHLRGENSHGEEDL